MGKPKILIVEDEVIIALDIQARLTRLGYEVCGMAHSADEAIQQAARMRPDVVLMDINLHGKASGIQAAAILHARFDIPTVYVTGQSDEATRSRAEATGPIGYVVKPLTEKQLRSAIDRAVTGRGKTVRQQ